MCLGRMAASVLASSRQVLRAVSRSSLDQY